MASLLRELIFDFSAVMCPRDNLDARDTCINQLKDMAARVQKICSPYHEEIGLIDTHLKSKKLYESITDEIDVKDLMRAFLDFDDNWRQQASHNDGKDDAPLSNQFKYQHTNYLSRTAERFDKAYSQLGLVQQQALSYVMKPEASMIVVMLHYGAEHLRNSKDAVYANVLKL